MDTRTLCLAVLSHGPASGYEIKKAFEDGPYGHIQDIGFGSIYPALARLLDEGSATVIEHAQEGRPAKKVYSITPSGRLALLDALEAPGGADKFRSDFLFRLLFAHLMPASAVEGLLAQRRSELHATIERMKAHCEAAAARPGERFVHGFGLAVYEAMVAWMDEHGHEVVAASLLGERAIAE